LNIFVGRHVVYLNFHEIHEDEKSKTKETKNENISTVELLLYLRMSVRALLELSKPMPQTMSLSDRKIEMKHLWVLFITCGDEIKVKHEIISSAYEKKYFENKIFSFSFSTFEQHFLYF
jgi:hypothetical protein